MFNKLIIDIIDKYHHNYIFLLKLSSTSKFLYQIIQNKINNKYFYRLPLYKYHLLINNKFYQNLVIQIINDKKLLFNEYLFILNSNDLIKYFLKDYVYIILELYQSLCLSLISIRRNIKYRYSEYDKLSFSDNAKKFIQHKLFNDTIYEYKWNSYNRQKYLFIYKIYHVLYFNFTYAYPVDPCFLTLQINNFNDNLDLFINEWLYIICN